MELQEKSKSIPRVTRNAHSIKVMDTLPQTTLPPLDHPPLNFTGRTRILQEIHTALIRTETETELSKKFVALIGVDGIGKRTTLKKFAQDFKNYYENNIFWMNAESEDSLKQSFLSLVEHFNISRRTLHQIKSSSPTSFPESEFKLLVQQIYNHLNTKSLFLFCNANDIQCDKNGLVIQDYLPQRPLLYHPHFLVTSNRIILGNEIPVVQLTNFNEEEIVEFFRKPSSSSVSSKSNEFLASSLKKLGRILNGHPLSLNLVSTFSAHDHGREVGKQNSKTDLRMNHLIHKLGENEQANDQDLMVTLLDTMLVQINENSKLAVDLLHILSFLPSNDIPVSMCHAIFMDIPLRPWTLDSFGKSVLIGIQGALRILVDHSLISIVESEDGKEKISIHGLVQQWTRQSIKFHSQVNSMLIKVVKYFKKNKTILPRDYWLLFGGQLKENLWPEESWKSYLDFVVWDFRFGNKLSGKEIKLVREVYDFLKKRGQEQEDGDPGAIAEGVEYLKLCQMILVFDKHELFQPYTNCVEPSFVFHNFEFFERTHPLCEVRADQFLGWVMDEAIQYENNHSIQIMALHVVHSVRIHLIKDEGLRSKFSMWTQIFCNALQCPETTIDNWRSSMFLGIYRMQDVHCSQTVYIQYIIQMLEIRMKTQDHFNCCQLMTDALSNVFDWPSGVRKSEIIYKADYEAGLATCRLFLSSGGLDILTQLLALVQQQIHTGLYVSGSEVFEKILSLVHYKECAKVLLDSDEFKKQIHSTIGALNSKIGLFMEDVENNVNKLYYLNYLDKILVTWLALFIPRNRKMTKGQQLSSDHLSLELERCTQTFEAIFKCLERLSKEERTEVFMYTDWFTSKSRLHVLNQILTSTNKTKVPSSYSLAKQLYDFYLLFRPKWRRRLQVAFNVS